jgi:hypothetical protein
MKLKQLKILVAIQLKNKMDFSFLESKGKLINKIVYTILGFGLIVAFSYFLFGFFKDLNVFSLVNFVQSSILTVIFTVMLSLSTVYCVFGLIKTLYFSKDNIVLLTFPVHTSFVFLSKLIVFYIYELKRSLTFLLPVFLSYGLVNSFSLPYFLWVIVGFFFISFIPVLVGALISIPVMYVVQFIRQVRIIEFSLFAILLSTLFYFAYTLIALIPENINLIGKWGSTFWKIRTFLEWWTSTFAAFDNLVTMLVGNFVNFKQVLFSGQTFIILAQLIAFLGIIGLVVFALTRPLFFKMSSKNFEFKSKNGKKSHKNKKRSRFATLLKKELLLNFRNSSALYQGLSIMVMMPLLIFLLNKIFLAMNIRTSGINMTLSFNLLLTVLILLASNNYVASSYSKEGKSSYLIKTEPMAYHFPLVSKLIIPFVFSLFSLIITTLVLTKSPYFTSSTLILFFFAVLFVYISHLLWSAELDILNPKNAEYSSSGDGYNNSNENKSTILAFFLSIFVFAYTLFMFREGQLGGWVKLVVFAFAFMIFRIYMFYMKIKIYYKEI